MLTVFSVVNNFLTPHIEGLIKLCECHKLSQLWVFGSVLTELFTEDSDIDFLYEFEQGLTPDEELDHLLGFIESATEILNRRIDLVWVGGLRNPYFKEEVDQSKQLIYVKESEEVGALFFPRISSKNCLSF